MKRKVKRFDEGGYAALLADAQAADREREGLPSMDDSTSNDKGYSGSEAIQDESGTVSKLRRNTETGDLYNPEGNFPAPSSKTKARSAAAPVTRVSKTTRIEPIISEDRNKQMIADMKSEEAAEKVIRDKEWNKTQNEFDEKNKKGVGVGSSAAPTRGMRTRTKEEKAMGAKTLEEGLPSAIPIGRGLKYAKGALDELRTVNAAKQLAGPSSQKLLSGPSSPKLLTGPKGETKLLTSNVSKSSAENSPAIEQAMTGRSMSSGAIKRQSERDRIAALRERRGITQGPRNMGYKSGGSVSSASSRGDGIAQRGKTRGKVC